MRKSVAPPPPRSTNGNGSISAEDSDSTSGESLEGSMELGVMLPDGRCVRMSTEKRTPMMDLLVQVTKANGLSPGSFVLDVKNERGRDSIRYKPSTAVGSLNTGVVYVVPKSLIREVTVRKDVKTGNQPFEKTFRLRVHLPRNQLHVLRVGQSTPLVEVFGAICTERELNPARYELRHPVHTEERLDPQRCLADYGLTEVAVVAVRGPSSGFSRSSSDIMSLQHDDDRKKHRFFGFMFKKSKSSKSIGDNSSDGHSSRGVSPTRSDGSGRQSISPPPSTVGYAAVNGASRNNNNNNNNANKASKKRPAPPPPKAVAPPAPAGNENGDVLTATSHSRHSSDSSGYHEASILSDSIETAGHDVEILAPNRAPVPGAKRSGAPPSNLTTINSTSMLSVSSGPKKRKAPAPPPSRPVSVVLPNDKELPSSTVVDSVDARLEAQIEAKQSVEGRSPGERTIRKDSVSSHSSSACEEIGSVTAAVEPTTPQKVPKPIPLPRLQTGKISPSQHVESSDDSAVRTSSNDINDELRLPVVSNESPGAKCPGADADTSNAVVLSDAAEVLEESNDSDVCTTPDSSNRKPVREKSVADDVIEVAAEAATESRISSTDKGNVDSTSSSRRSSASSRASSHSGDVDKVVNETEAVSDVKDPPLPKEIKEISVQTNFEDCGTDARRSSATSDDGGREAASGSSSRKSSGGRPDERVSRRISQPADDGDSNAAPELFSLDERRNSDAMIENQPEDSSEREASELHPGQSSPPISAASSPPGSSGSGEQRVKEADVTALSARIDKAVSEHKIAAEIDEAFASIDMMDSGSEVGSNVDDKESRKEEAKEGAASEADPVITWEYRIPEVPAQFQNDYDEKRQTATGQDVVTSSIGARSADPPVERPNAITGDILIAKDEEVYQIQKVVPPPLQENAPRTEREPAEVICKRPVMSFSISTYKSRVKEESEYGHKLTKAESFSQRPQLAKSTSVDSSAPPKPIVPVKHRARDSAPGHSLSIAKAITAVKEEPEGEKSGPDPKAPGGESPRTKPEDRTVDRTAPGTTTAEQELLQQEYLKLHSQFLQWQQQLLQNQTVLQQQQILPESTTETLQRIQELQQQVLASKSEAAAEKTEVPQIRESAASNGAPRIQESAVNSTTKANSLPRPKSAFAAPASAEGAEPSNSLERRLPRVGPRPWIPRPVTISLGSWQPPRPKSVSGATGNGPASLEPTIVIEDKAEDRAQSTGARQSDSNRNAETRNVPTAASAKQPARATSFPRHPVVKGFASVVEQVQPPKSKVVVNGSATNGGTNPQKRGVVRVNVGTNGVDPKAATTNGRPAVSTFTYFGDRVDNRNDANATNGGLASTEYDGRSMVIMSNNNNNNNNNVTKKSTTVVVNAAPSRQQNSLTPPPPPPQPLPVLKISQTKMGGSGNGQASRKSVSSPESDEDKRDELMLAIRGFGGRHGLKKVSSTETGWQTRHGNL